MQTERDIAAIGQCMSCEMFELGQGIAAANQAISTVQMIEASARSIRQNLASMEELAEKEVYHYCTCAEKAAMQQEVQRLGERTNEIIDVTDAASGDGSEHNKLFSGEGHTMDISAGRGRTLHIFPADMSVPMEEIDLTKDGKAALATIKEIHGRAKDYVDSLESQSAFLLEIISTMAERVATSQEIGAMDFSVVSESAVMIGEMFAEEPELLHDCQAHVSPGDAMRVLYN